MADGLHTPPPGIASGPGCIRETMSSRQAPAVCYLEGFDPAQAVREAQRHIPSFDSLISVY